MSEYSTFLVTGASRGIGRAIATSLAQEGRRIALTARSEGDLQEVAAEIEKRGGTPLLLAADLTDPNACTSLVQRLVADWGGVDVLVNNAGYLSRGTLEDLELENLDRMMDLNFRALTHLCKGLTPKMVENKRGAVINISSIAGTEVIDGMGGYCASKFAVRAFSKAAFTELRKHGIKVSTICPGLVATDMSQPFGLDGDRMIRPEDIARTVHFVLESGPTFCPREIHLMPQQEQP